MNALSSSLSRSLKALPPLRTTPSLIRLSTVRFRHSQPPLPSIPDGEIDKYKEYYQSLRSLISNPPESIASKSPGLVALHKRLNLPKQFNYGTLARCLTSQSGQISGSFTVAGGSSHNSTVESNTLCDNKGLNIFGKNLLTYHVTLALLEKYPRLPTVVLNAAVNAYLDIAVLGNVAKSWGLEPETTSILQRYLDEEPLEMTLGRLRYYNNSLSKEDGVELISNANYSLDSAMSLAVRSIIGALWATTCTESGTTSKIASQFIDEHIMSRKLDITKLFEFEEPTRELAVLCRRENLARPVSKLVAESGRFSKAPVFIVGVFSNEEVLGEGFGSSLKEAKARASTDALLKWYCYEPVKNAKLETVIDPGTVIV